ncbi:MAG TPA: TonB family protein [Acidobacteriaceae bacterium]|nr:TonB family protein [Acidobacteriaceae bacterium]
MPTQTTTRGSIANHRFGGDIAGSLLLHASLAGLAVVAGLWYRAHSGQNWGDTISTAGAISATMVNSLPLPPKPPSDQQNILATDTSSPAPVAPAPKTIEAARPDDIPVPVKSTQPAKTADKTTQAPPLHPQPVKIDPTKAQTGEAASLSVPMSSTQTRAGTISINMQQAAFGVRGAYYVQGITQKVASHWYTNMLDARAGGHRVYITFQIEKDGSLSHIQIAQPSGDSTLDQTALRAVQEIDTFGQLPEWYTGSHINVTYYFDPPPAH